MKTLIELSASYLVVVFTFIIYLLCFKRCIKEKLKINLKKTIIILILSVLVMVNNIYNPFWFKSFATIIILFAGCKIIFQKNWKHTLGLVIVFSLISIILDFISGIFLNIAFKNINEFNDSIMAKSMLTIIIWCLLYFIINNKIFDYIMEAFIKKDKQKVIYVIFFLFIIVFSIFSYIYISDYKNFLVYILTVIIIITFSILMAQILKKDFEQNKLLIQYKFLQENIQNYEGIIEEYKDLKHNLNNDMMAIRSIVDEPAQRLIDEKLEKYNSSSSLMTNVRDIPKGLQGLLFLKISNLKQQGITVEINTNDKDAFDILDIKNYSILCDLFGIILDNAIEATKKSDEKLIYIDITFENNQLNIKTINTFMDCMDLDLIGEKNYSTKKIKSGRGLHYIDKITKKNKFKVKKEIINNLFIASITFSLNEY